MTAKERLRKGNEAYAQSGRYGGDVSEGARLSCADGQKPYAVVLTCADSRVIPEAIFSAGIGDLFVLRVAGNVADEATLGSVEYAIDHLGVRLVLVLGHTRCGAVNAALFHGSEAEGYVRAITDRILLAIGDETDEKKACARNVAATVEALRDAFPKNDVEILGAVYDTLSGTVAW